MAFVVDSMWTMLAPLVLKSVVGLVVTGLVGAFMWPLRKARKEWIILKQEQASIHSELVQQRTNCLTTLQHQGDAQITLLGKMAGTLENIALSQAEMTGYCKANSGIGCGPRIRRRTAKK